MGGVRREDLRIDPCVGVSKDFLDRLFFLAGTSEGLGRVVGSSERERLVIWSLMSGSIGSCSVRFARVTPSSMTDAGDASASAISTLRQSSDGNGCVRSIGSSRVELVLGGT